jgi:hypothetical protein
VGGWPRFLISLALLQGSIKGDVKKKHFSALLRGGFFLISSPSAAARTRCQSGDRVADACAMAWFRASFCACKQRVGRGQPWFYLRLATKRGTIAFSGCPREHTVPRETVRLNPAWILTLEPERSATAGSRDHDAVNDGPFRRLCALKLLVASDARR